jgi:serine kinase of HPr protein (carbohydrate metabolism regulator)
MSETLHQFTCVSLGGRALLIAGAPGAGKSSLALALIEQGAVLVGDDGVALRVEGDRLIAAPAPATRGLIEVRGVGIVPMPVAQDVPVALLIRLTHAAPRFIEEPPRETVLGVALPAIALWPEGLALPLRARLAMERHGLPVGV